MAVLDQYTYIFVIGTFFAFLDAYNNGANDVANAWATSVSSRSISYRQAMVLGTIFELLGACLVGSRTASTIKNGIIPLSAFRNDAGVQMLAFTCALAGASIWVMWCTRHSAHVSSTYSLISSIAGVGIALAGAENVQWGWNKGTGMGAIFAGLGMAPLCAACLGAIVFMLIKLVVHVRKNPVPWSVYTSPFFFLVASSICTLSVVYKGSPRLGLNKKPAWYIASVVLGVGFGVAILAAIFFVPYVHAKVIRRDSTVKWYHAFQGPLLFKRPAPADGTDLVRIPNFAVVQHDEDDELEHESHLPQHGSGSNIEDESSMGEKARSPVAQPPLHQLELTYEEQLAIAQERLHAKMRRNKGPFGWAMRFLHENQRGPGAIYELHNVRVILRRIPAQIVVGFMYGIHYDIHAAQSGISGTPEGRRMEQVYSYAHKYSNEVEYSYSFIQIITACTASFAHGANDIGNSVAPWAVIYSAWKTGDPAASKLPVDTWQLAVLALAISLGLCTYGFNIMKVMGNKITYHSPSRGSSMEMGAALTVLIFSQYALPVSTSMCITGATVGVGLTNGSFKAVNWHRVGLLGISWIATIPIAGLIGGITMGLFLNAPHFSS